MNHLKISVILTALLLSNYADAACRLGYTPVSFGNYDEMSTTRAMGFGTVSSTCDALGPLNILLPGQVKIQLGVSRNSNTFNRLMTNGLIGRLSYNIFIDPSLTKVFGDDTFSTSSISATMSPLEHKSWTIYGSIPARQNPRAGIYNDTMTITLLP